MLGYTYVPTLFTPQYLNPNVRIATSPEVSVANLAYSGLKAVSCGSGGSG